MTAPEALNSQEAAGLAQHARQLMMARVRAVFGAAASNGFVVDEISDDPLRVSFVHPERDRTYLDVAFSRRTGDVLKTWFLDANEATHWRERRDFPDEHTFDFVDRAIQAALA